MKNIITLSILLALSFSIVHEFVFTSFDDNKCSVSEFVSELDAPTGSDDICDIHYEYHQAYIFAQEQTKTLHVERLSTLTILKESYNFSLNQDLVIPPLV